MTEKTNFTCPECGEEISPSNGKSPYKHIVNCMHVPDIGVNRLEDMIPEMDKVRADKLESVLIYSKLVESK